MQTKNKHSILFSIIAWAIFIFSGQVLNAQSIIPKEAQLFSEGEGVQILFHDGIYFIKDVITEEVKTTSRYTFISAFNEGHAIVKTKDADYGLIDRSLNEIVAPQWEKIIDISNQYILVASHTGQMKYQDRGLGERSYPELGWQLCYKPTGQIVSEFVFKNPLALYGEINAYTLGDEPIIIKLAKINFNYSNPLLKAIQYQTSVSSTSSASNQTELNSVLDR